MKDILLHENMYEFSLMQLKRLLPQVKIVFPTYARRWEGGALRPCKIDVVVGSSVTLNNDCSPAVE